MATSTDKQTLFVASVYEEFEGVVILFVKVWQKADLPSLQQNVKDMNHSVDYNSNRK